MIEIKTDKYRKYTTAIISYNKLKEQLCENGYNMNTNKEMLLQIKFTI